MLTAERVELIAPTRTVEVSGIIDNNDWFPSSLSETAIRWDNAPKNDTTRAIGFVGEGTGSGDPARMLGAIVVWHSDAQGTYYRLDVTDYVLWGQGLNAGFSNFATRDADGILTFLLANNIPYRVSNLNDYSEFDSREVPAECDRPHLEVYQ